MSRRVDAITWRHIGDEEACNKLRGKARQLAQQAIDLGYKVKRYNLGAAFITIRYQEKFNACQVVIQTGVRKTEDWTPHLVAVLRGGSITPWWFIDLFNFFGGYYDYMELDTVAQRIKDDKDISKLPEIKGTKSQIANPWVTSGSQTWIHPDTGKAISIRYRGYSKPDEEVEDIFCGFGSQVACQPYTDCSIYFHGINILQGVYGLGGVHIKGNHVVGYTAFPVKGASVIKIIKYSAVINLDTRPNYPFKVLPSLKIVDTIHLTVSDDYIRIPYDQYAKGANMVVNREGDKTIFYALIDNGDDEKHEVFIINDKDSFTVSKYLSINAKHTLYTVINGQATETRKKQQDPVNAALWEKSGDPLTCAASVAGYNDWHHANFDNTNSDGTYNEYTIEKLKNIIGVAFNRFTDEIMIATYQIDRKLTVSYSSEIVNNDAYSDNMFGTIPPGQQTYYSFSIPDFVYKNESFVEPYTITGSAVITDTDHLKLHEKDNTLIDTISDVYIALGSWEHHSYATDKDDFSHEYTTSYEKHWGTLQIIDLANELYIETIIDTPPSSATSTERLGISSTGQVPQVPLTVEEKQTYLFKDKTDLIVQEKVNEGFYTPIHSTDIYPLLNVGIPDGDYDTYTDAPFSPLAGNANCGGTLVDTNATETAWWYLDHWYGTGLQGYQTFEATDVMTWS